MTSQEPGEGIQDQVVLYEGVDHRLHVEVRVEGDSVWLTQKQIANLFDVQRPAVTRHLRNIFTSGELDEDATSSILEHMAPHGQVYATKYYNLDAIISVGYRVNSKSATAFRVWATGVLRQHLIQGYTINQHRLDQLGKVLEILGRSDNEMVSGVADLLRRFTTGLDLLDAYDHHTLTEPAGGEPTWELTYDEARQVIDAMRFGSESTLFGQERDDSFKGIIPGLYQSFGGVVLYPSVQEKAVNLLYLVTKDHSFSDGNKRIAAALFVYFLEKNHALLDLVGRPVIGNNTLAAITVMIAVSKPEEKTEMCLLVTNMLTRGEA